MNDREVYRQVANLHYKYIDQGFLATLGSSFLSILYESIDSSESGVLIVQRNDTQVTGFVAGTENIKTIYLEMLKHSLRLLQATIAELVHPVRLYKLFEIFFFSIKRRSTLVDLPAAELLSIVVDPDFRGKGIAQNIYLQLSEHFWLRGMERFQIVVGEALVDAHNFYRGMGAIPVQTIEVHRGSKSSIYIQEYNDLPSQYD